MNASLALISLMLGFQDKGALDFENSIRPLLKTHCFECHGEGKKNRGGLDLRLKKSMARGGESGPAIEPGKPGKSLLVEKIQSGEMPPGKQKLSPKEIKVVENWIAAGAKTAKPEPDTLARGFVITQGDREHWAYQPIRLPLLPITMAAASNPIDRFLLAKLEAKGLRFSPSADKVALARRAYFDLIGLPPTPAELNSFLEDSSEKAFEKLLDHLLASPQYGERWARHWLDIAGYADSEGYDGADTPRLSAYHYRDYVIRSFNQNKPIDQFILEQLAGDEMAGPSPEKFTALDWEKMIATGFLRMAPDGTGAAGVDLKLAANQTMADTLQIVSTSLLGQTAHCAQCHNHRYDPISQVDYFRLRAVFEPAFSGKKWQPPAAREVKFQSETDKEKTNQVEKAAAVVDQKRQQRFAEVQKEIFEKSLEKVPVQMQQKVRAAFESPPAKRTKEQVKLLSDYPNSNVNTGLVIQRNAKLDAEFKSYLADAAKIRAEKPLLTSYRVLRETQEKPPETRRFERGDPDQPKEIVPPGQFELFQPLGLAPIPLDDPAIPTTGRRLALARSLVAKNHPLTSRVFVNRIWMHHFGKGIVSTPADFGKLGASPSHRELLDWLAYTFRESGWNLKELHKRIMLSQAYCQTSAKTALLQSKDPENQLLGRMPVKRLEGEIVRDAALAVAGKMNAKMFGPPVPVTPDDYGQIIIGKDTRDAAGRFTNKKSPLGGEEFRRSIYIQVLRSSPLAVFESFDAPMQAPNCENRNFSTSATQSLLMLNSQFIQDHAEWFAQRLLKEFPKDRTQQVEQSWLLAYSARPSAQEKALALEFIARQEKVFQELKIKSSVLAGELSLASFTQAILASNRFLYVE
ncbi:MAG: DUF1553 domain-containing protein [Gemmataceae bacterium]|nr:DUF1553 domain-containing protein [Gemmataceae bacterium]